MAPMPFIPRTMPTPMACPKAPRARTSAAVSPAGSLDTSPEALSDIFSPADAGLLAVGASPKRPATSGSVVARIIIWLVADPRYSARTTWCVRRAWVFVAAVYNMKRKRHDEEVRTEQRLAGFWTGPKPGREAVRGSFPGGTRFGTPEAPGRVCTPYETEQHGHSKPVDRPTRRPPDRGRPPTQGRHFKILSRPTHSSFTTSPTQIGNITFESTRSARQRRDVAPKRPHPCAVVFFAPAKSPGKRYKDSHGPW